MLKYLKIFPDEALAFAGSVGTFVVRVILHPLRRRWSNEEVLSYLDETAFEGRGMLLDLYQLEQKSEIEEAGAGSDAHAFRREVSADQNAKSLGAEGRCPSVVDAARAGSAESRPVRLAPV